MTDEPLCARVAAVAERFASVEWHAPFYKVVTHGLYVAFDDACVNADGNLTEKGREFLAKKKIKALVLCHRHRPDPQVPEGVTVFRRPLADFTKWAQSCLVEQIARRHAYVGVLVDAPDAWTLAILTVLDATLHNASLSASLRTVCAAVGGGALVDAPAAQALIAELIEALDDGRFEPDAADAARELSATQAAMHFFARNAHKTLVPSSF